MSDDSFLMDSEYATQPKATTVAELTVMGQKMRALRDTMLRAQAAYETAKGEYEHYAHIVMPLQMRSAGVDEFKLSDGGSIRLKRNFYCQPNKNVEDQKRICGWLIEHGGDRLVKPAAKVTGAEALEALSAAGIEYEESPSVNTTSLKAFVKDLLGVSGGTKLIDIDDLPKCMHFSEVQTVEFEDVC